MGLLLQAGSIGCNLVSVGRSRRWVLRLVVLVIRREEGGKKGGRVAQLSVGLYHEKRDVLELEELLLVQHCISK